MQDKRCVHLDFHTSEEIDNLAADFDKETFKNRLIQANIDSITLFAKCHHGCFYYKDSAFFVHPNMKNSLLDEQLAACSEAGVSAKIYISAGFDEYEARLHPEWLRIPMDGKPQPDDYFRRMCFNTPYLDKLLAETEEVVKKYKPDGLFFDIVGETPCKCPACLADMKKKGLNPDSYNDLMRQAVDVFDAFYQKINARVKALSPKTLVFHNAGDFEAGRFDRLDSCSQLEAESLPTGGWGYDHFPLTMSYIRRKGKNCIGMTGKFHKTWGEFGGYKYPEALRYEAALCLAFGAGMSIGDQMHPSGVLDEFTYNSIGEVMNFVSKNEIYGGGKYLPELALYSAECADVSAEGNIGTDKSVIGASRILFEGKYLFDRIDKEEISNAYPLIIISSDAELTQDEIARFKAYVSGGGKVIACGRAAFSGGKPLFDLGAEFIGRDEETPCYFRADYKIDYADKMALVIYEKVYNIRAASKTLVTKISPYFKREGARFCSHFQTPCDYRKTSPAVTCGKDGIYIAADLFTQYAKDGSLTPKQLILPLVNMLLGEKRIKTDFPSAGKITLYEKQDRYALHLAYGNTMKRGDGVEVLEDIVTLSSVTVSVLGEKPSAVTLFGEPVEFTYKDGRTVFTLRDFNCYAAVELFK